ncbi:CCR4-NOT core DEDD RNase subunit [Ascochyta rabiei]|uniref:poly(A)-specific ribonuclease n=1 Tax=Didymella rabiei TaxID=5454 RepID=A0A162XCK0_DIDRA|nr:CCR4-NOT core DEDD RNase subunit [Ascochyta rabiei]KZM19469.1 nucleic acid binding [Ascochyta rabiei]UPX12520.1 CCR4-NOT core DEDD RNase subunit [Ascochyta rabiei]
MPPRFPGHNLSNPFAHLSAPIHQQPQLQQQHQQHQPNMPHPSFGGGNQAHNINLFGQNQHAFQSNNAGLTGGLGGAGLGAAAGLGGVSGGTGLDGHEARMRFAHGAQLQQDAVRGQDGTKGLAGQRIRDVWRSNLHQEMDLLRSLIDQYPYISMDTEFPGVVARPIGDFNSKASYHYQTVRCNVDLLKIIQLGVTLFSIQGEIPPSQLDSSTLQYQPKSLQRYANNIVMCPCTWSFNFQFSLEDDMYNEESIQMLKKSGADFEKHASQGIDPQEFGSLLITSGMTLSEDVNWISFHSGYDFAYLVKMLSSKPLPEDEDSYRKLVEVFFPRLLDVKYLWRHANNLVRRGIIGASATSILNNLGTKSGLQDLADELGCQRIGNSHTAGSDAWLTGTVFWELKKKIFDGSIPDEMNGQMWGLTGVGPPASATAQAAVLAAQGQQNLTGFQGLNGGMMFHPGNARHGDGPSTPTNHPAGLATTPGPTGHMTPGGGYGGYGGNK